MVIYIAINCERTGSEILQIYKTAAKYALRIHCSQITQNTQCLPSTQKPGLVTHISLKPQMGAELLAWWDQHSAGSEQPPAQAGKVLGWRRGSRHMSTHRHLPVAGAAPGLMPNPGRGWVVSGFKSRAERRGLAPQPTPLLLPQCCRHQASLPCADPTLT